MYQFFELLDEQKHLRKRYHEISSQFSNLNVDAAMAALDSTNIGNVRWHDGVYFHCCNVFPLLVKIKTISNRQNIHYQQNHHQMIK
jgi:hypothetical protein